MRRFRLRRLWRVNCETLMRAAGQNLKRLLKRRGWGRRPCPAEALHAPLFGCSWVVYASYKRCRCYFLDDVLRISMVGKKDFIFIDEFCWDFFNRLICLAALSVKNANPVKTQFVRAFLDCLDLLGFEPD